jgi:hypothetical protein
MGGAFLKPERRFCLCLRICLFISFIMFLSVYIYLRITFILLFFLLFIPFTYLIISTFCWQVNSTRIRVLLKPKVLWFDISVSDGNSLG